MAEEGASCPEPPQTESSTPTKAILPLSSKASVDEDDVSGNFQYHSGAIAENTDTLPATPSPYPANHHHKNNRNVKPVFPAWTRFTSALHRTVTHSIVTLSVFSARNPYSVIVGAILLSFTMATIGLLTNFEINVEENEIFAPFRTIPVKHMKWRDEQSGFQRSTRVTTLVIHADGANVLGKEPLERVFHALDTVRNISGYHDICKDGDYYDERTNEWTCRILATTRFWYHDPQLFYEQVQTDEDVIATISQPLYPVNVPADHDFVLGKHERDDNGTITFVPAFFVFVLLSVKEDTEVFEAKVIEQLSVLQAEWIKEEGNMLRLDYFAERSFSDEFTRAIQADMYLVPIGFIMMAGLTCIVFYNSDRVQSRSGLGIGSVFTIVLSIMTGFGLLFICGIPYTSMTTILPFVIIGVGLDDTFIIAGDYLRRSSTLDTVERVRMTMEEVAIAITTTTATTIVAFVFGLSSSVPAIYWLCLYAFPTIAIDFFYQVTVFIAILVLDERRIKDQREDICICTKRPVLQIDNLNVDDTYGDVAENTAAEGLVVQEKHIIDKIMAKYAKFLMRPVIKGTVVVIFTYFFALCVYRTTLLKQEFDITELFPTGSYASRVLNVIQTYQERSLQVEIYFRNVNQSDPAIQSEMLQFVEDITEMPSFGKGPPLCWVRDFQLLRETEYFSLVEDMTFEEQVVYALSIPAIKEAYGMDIVHNNGTISASRCIIVMKNTFLESVAEQISVLRDQRAITGAQPINEGLQVGSEKFFTFNQIYLLWAFFSIAVSELISTTISSVVAVCFVTLLFIPHWSAMLFIVPMVIIVYIDLLGTMQVAGLHINAVTYVCLVIAIGLIVDFISHVLLRYNESTYKTREGKVKDTLETMGSAIFLGGFSTFLGVIPLAFSTSTILRTVFTSLVAMVVLSLSHGLILLPVILSAVGPYDAEREDIPKSSGTRKIGSLKYDPGLTFESTSSDAEASPKSSSSSERA